MEPMVPFGDHDALTAWLSGTRVLVIDDEPANLQFLRHVLGTEGYGDLVTIKDPVEAVARFSELAPDLIIVDVMMPELDGFEVIARVRALSAADAYLPILVATADHAPETRRRALSAGARDFLTKPLSPAEVRLRVRNLMETRFLHEQLRGYTSLLELRVAERTQELEEARLEILVRLARAAEFRDDQTGQHTMRVGQLARQIGELLGLPTEACELIGRAAPLHDIGKIGIPDSVLLKPDRLDAEELAIIRTHTVIGANILAGSRYPLLQLAEEIALCHHERWDGGGYPRGLAADAIPLSGRIVAVADVFDSLSHERPYKRAWTKAETLAEISAQAGSQFDAAVVDALLRITGMGRVRRTAASRNGATATAAAAGSPATQVAMPRVKGPATNLAPARADADATMLTARLKSVEAERDLLAREVDRLRRLIAGHEGPVERLTASTQPN
jgi:putative two-component system response regulator